MAAWPPADVLDELERLDRPERAGVRWTTRDQWHVTLRFLGSADVGEAADALQSVAADRTEAVVGPVVERLGRAVVALPVDGLTQVATVVASAMVGVGEDPERRAFRGHLTLARLRKGGRPPLVGTPFTARFPVDEVCLVESRTHREGARYRTVATVALR